MKLNVLTIGILLLPFLLNAQIRMKKEEGGILFTEKNQQVLLYQVQPKDRKGKYSRCHYIHPLWANDGSVLTEDFPQDHLHHRGIFWAWHQIWIGDQRIGDPWEIKDFNQEVNEVEFIAQSNGSGILQTEVDWSSPIWKKDDRNPPYMKEKTKITIHPSKGNYRKIDFEISLLALAEGLTMGGSEDDKGYSGFSVRMKCPKDISFNGPTGRVEAQRTAVESPGFVNVSGSVLKNEKQGGIVMVDHPDNPGYPQSWILREKRSMQNAAYPGRNTVKISTSSPLVLKYSLIVYSGKLNNKKIQRLIE